MPFVFKCRTARGDNGRAAGRRKYLSTTARGRPRIFHSAASSYRGRRGPSIIFPPRRSPTSAAPRERTNAARVHVIYTRIIKSCSVSFCSVAPLSVHNMYQRIITMSSRFSIFSPSRPAAYRRSGRRPSTRETFPTNVSQCAGRPGPRTSCRRTLRNRHSGTASRHDPNLSPRSSSSSSSAPPPPTTG